MGSEAGSVAPAGDARRVRPPGLVWDRSAAVLGAMYALPGAVVILSDRSRGLALAVGVLPAAIAGLMVLGSVFACLVAMLWPEHAAVPLSVTGPKPTLEYGVRLGAAGATAAAVGFLLDLEHVGWACAAALLVMRPAAEMQRLRSVGRVLAVAIGALAAIAIVRLGPSPWVYSLAALAAVAGAAATHRSRCT